MADHDVEAEFVGQLLQFTFPQPDPRAVAAAAIGGDQQPGRVGVTRPPEVEPRLADAVHHEGGRVGKPIAKGQVGRDDDRGALIEPG